MQQTEKYGFNLIETGDTFSPEPLNENARKMEEALDAKGNCTVLMGGYVGDDKVGREIFVGCTPKVLIIGGFGITLATSGSALNIRSSSTSSADSITFTETGFQLKSNYYTNRVGVNYRYIAFV